MFLFKKFNIFKDKTYDPFTVEGEGIYTSKDWALTRSKSEELFRTPNDVNYLTSLFSAPGKINVAYKLNKFMNLKKYSMVGDIGGLPFFQSLILNHLNPHLKFINTDFDNISLEIIKRIKILGNLNLQFFDAKKNEYSIFDKCDLITLWGVDPCLNDDDLYRLFSYIKEKNTKLLICSLHCDGFLFRLKKIFLANRKNLFKKKPYNGRDHILLRTYKYFKFIANKHDLVVKKLFVSDIYIVYEIN